MQSPSIDARALRESGVEALRRGDARSAREAFARIVEAGPADASACIGLAYACRSLNDHAASLAAIDTAHTPYGTYVQVTRFSTSVFGNGLTIFFSDGQPESE